MNPPFKSPRPGLLTFIGVVSVVWSALSLIGGVIAGVVVVLLGAGSWFLGPAAGAVGTAIGLLVVVWLVVSSILSIVLFVAGWKTLHDDPDGIRLHRIWAWISLALDAVALLSTAGSAPNSWAGVIYALAVLYITGQPEVVAYFHGDPSRPAAKPGGWTDDLA